MSGPVPRIRTPDQRLRVFVSSTLRELAEERAAVRAAIENIRLTPVMFELGARPHPPRDLYRAYLEQSDVFVGIYWQQYGWIAPDQDESGLEDEYRLSADHPRLVYVREPAPSRDRRLGELLEEMQSGGMSYRHFRDVADLAEAVSEDLAVLLSERFEDSGAEPVAREDESPVYRVPSVPSRFIGREQAIEDVRHLLLDPQTRLVDLVGPGGTGKTRLALEVAGRLRGEFRDGVVSVVLASVRSPELVPTSIMAALRMPEVANRSPIDTLTAFLADRELLLVLDNFEHVVDAAPLLVDLLASSAEVKMLVTSREVLHVTGEVVYQVPPLQLPPAAGSEEELATSESVELFVERARAAGSDLAADGESLAVVAEICRRLEGIPLAIELAAARTRVFDPAEILDRLDHSLRLLTGGPRDLPPRQQALHLTIQWSYDLLPDSERALFEILGVFVGGFSLGAAEEVAAGCGLSDVLDGIIGLVDRSLVTAQGTVAGEPRYLILETVREFVQARLEESGGLATAQRVHARYFLESTVARHRDFETGEEARLVEAYDADRGNLRAAMRWLLDHDELADVTRLGLALWQYWWNRSLFEEGIDALEHVLARQDVLTEEERGDAGFALGMCRFGLSDYHGSRPIFEEAQASYRKAGHELGAAMCATPLWTIAALEGDPLAEEAFRDAIGVLRGHRYDWGLAFALFGYGKVLVIAGRFDEATPVLEEGVRRASRTEVLRSHVLLDLGWARRGTGDLSGSVRAFQEALERLAAMENPQGMSRVLEGLAAVMLDHNDDEVAGELFGGAEGARRAVGAPVWGVDAHSHVSLEERLRTELGDTKFRLAFERGLMLSLDDIISSAHRAATAVLDD